LRIVARGVSKSYGGVRALDNVSLTIEPGRVTGVLGPNGAGKTTLLRALSGSLRVDSGSILVGGVDVVREPLRARRLVGFVAESSMLFPDLTVEDNLLFVARLYGVGPGEARRRMAKLAELLDAGELLGRRYGSLSKGQKRRADIMSALIHDPPVLFLDEPTGGLDPVSALSLRRLVRRLAREGVTVVVTTHYIAEAFEVSDWIIVLAGGRVVAEGEPERLRRMTSGREARIVAAVRGDAGAAAEALRRRGFKASARDGELVAVGPPGPLAEALVDAVREAGGSLESLAVRELSWEEVFTRLVGTARGAGEGCPCRCGA
jgi:ABC-type multidrug transport system ATPase subunit